MFSTIAKWFAEKEAIEIPSKWDRETYIPLHVLDLVGLLYPKVSDLEKNPEQFRVFCRLMLSLIHQQYRRRHQHLTHLYSRLDPDRDTPFPQFKNDIDDERVPPTSGTIPFLRSLQLDTTESTNQLFEEIGDILERANYRRLSPSQIQLAVGSASHWGVKLRVRFSMFRRLEVYARGDVDGVRIRRRWYRFWIPEQVPVPIYQRLIVLFRTKPDQSFEEELQEEHVHLRMFKNIPKYDVDMLLPGTGVRMNWIDRGKIGLPSLWGLSMLIWRILKNASLLAILGVVKMFASVLLGFAVVVAALYFIIKSIFSYSTTKRRYLLNVTRNLYYQHLDNNMGALLRLLDEAEQQEACESILAYFVLFSTSPDAPLPIEELDRRCETLLRELTGNTVDFDVEDAVRDLAPIGIITPCEKGWSALPLEEALQKLNEVWDTSFFPNPKIVAPFS